MASPRAPFGKRRRAAFAAVLLAGSALAGFGWYTDPAGAQPAPQNAPVASGPVTGPAANLPSFADLAARVRPAVVTITSTERVNASASNDSPFPQGSGPDEMFRRYFGGQDGMAGRPHPRTVQALGSGFVVDPEGHIVTNNHVINGATRVVVTLDDGRQLPAKVVGHDARTDLAVLQVEAGGSLPYLALGDSDKARVGDWVVAMGNPFGLGGTVTAGIVSARSRDIGAGPYDDFLQVDAPINRGNSGGPLFALDGTVIGVNTAILSPSGGSIGIGFAIPSNLVKTVVTQLEHNGHIERGWLGVSTQQISPDMQAALHLGNDHGALIADTQPNGPAASGGVQSGDVVTAVNGHAVNSPRDLAREIAALAPNSNAALTVQRDGKEQTIRVTLARMQDDGSKQFANNGGENGNHGIGVALQPVTPDLRQELNLPDDARGAVVAQVRPDSPAEAAGLRRGDVIVGVGNHAVTDQRDAVQAIRGALHDNHGAVALRIMRDGQTLFVAVKPADDTQNG